MSNGATIDHHFFLVISFTLPRFSDLFLPLVCKIEFPPRSRHRVRNLRLCRLSTSLRSRIPGSGVGYICKIYLKRLHKIYFTHISFTEVSHICQNIFDTYFCWNFYLWKFYFSIDKNYSTQNNVNWEKRRDAVVNPCHSSDAQ